MDKTADDGFNYALLHVLSQDVGVLGVFSDWPATTTFYANCMGLGLHNESVGDEDVPVADARNSVAGRRLSAMRRLVIVVFKLVGYWAIVW